MDCVKQMTGSCMARLQLGPCTALEHGPYLRCTPVPGSLYLQSVHGPGKLFLSWQLLPLSCLPRPSQKGSLGRFLAAQVHLLYQQ